MHDLKARLAMRPAVRQNLKRLINPRHIAFIGGHDADIALRACQRIGFKGHIWPVNPKRKTMGGLPCFADITQLPEPPDAVFLAVPAKPAVEIVEYLSNVGAGGVVCFTAGFGEDGAQGGHADQPLVDVAGDLALIGPNCYGLINFINHSALWPFGHGGYCPGYGAAIITQSGMLSSDITMNQRSLPLAYMVSAGNQSVLQLEDFIDVMCELDEVKAIGLHIEGLKDIQSFSQVAYKAFTLNKPIVVLKTGTSKIGAELTVSHTGSLSGTNELYQALFDRLGIINVQSPTQLVETLKFLSIAGQPDGDRIMGFTCSGGGATLLADYAETIGLEFPQPSTQVAAGLVDKLPRIADVTNPLDYTTPIWGQPDKVRPVFEAALKDNYDAAVIVQDFPLKEVDESKHYYLNDTQSFIHATSKANIPAAVISTLPENIDIESREFMIEHGIAPLQGIHEALEAINHATWYGNKQSHGIQPLEIKPQNMPANRLTRQQDEWHSKCELKAAGLTVPEGILAKSAQVGASADKLGFPLVLKVNSNQIAHKTELGAIQTNLRDRQQVDQSLEKIMIELEHANPAIHAEKFIVEKMQPSPIAELMISVRHDAEFGHALTLSSGGIFVELFADALTLLLPATQIEIERALEQLKISKLLAGFRSRSKVDMTMLSDSIKRITDYVLENKHRIAQLEINPLFVYPDHTCAVDVLTYVFDENV